ncbi:hypothetical protein VP01_3993g1 [Puccinia sorghi]|uniref:Uncharacterized protein n=1 Tax=Puccinia sorghi TaxID=27349 RepID=A0A0L6US39_9BASI|nr:hypothetical protein VP01_3993g1 [Puccinia sorghi]
MSTAPPPLPPRQQQHPLNDDPPVRASINHTNHINTDHFVTARLHPRSCRPISTSPSRPPISFREPTSVPTPGRPLLYEDRILVYPHINGTAYFCPKCCNTGFKGFDPYKPCRKVESCWQRYGRLWSVVRVSPMSNSGAWALQRPLPPAEMTLTPPPLVVQPGDPRIGGRLCLNCNGSGQKTEELTLINVFLGGGGQEVCTNCRGTGRIFF